MSSAAITMNDAIKKAIADATSPEQIKTLLEAERVRQVEEATTHKAEEDAAAAKAAADKAAADKAAADAAAKQSFTVTEVIAGREFTFEADSQAELNEMVMNAYRVAYAVQPSAEERTTVQVDPAVAAEQERKRAEAETAAKAELELKFKRGELSAAEYIEQSGVMESYLQKKGISVDDLKAAVEQTRTNSYEQSWAQATEEFRNSPAGSDWPGGPQNIQIIGLKLAAMGLTDAKDKVTALAQAYAAMKQEGLVFPGASSIDDSSAKAAAAKAAAEKAAADKAAADAAAAAAVAASTTHASARPASSSLFGTSSGVATTVKPAGDGKFEIPANATSEEILEIWKAQQLATGRDPNQAFMEIFSSKRA